MSLYRKKPVIVDAWLIKPLLHAAMHDWQGLPPEVRAAYEMGTFVFEEDALHIKTLEGDH